MSTSDLLCQIKRLKQMHPPQWTRFELISPYVGGITKEQLDMRRKAEILKYSNKSATSVKQLTKREKFALLSRANYKQSRKMNLYSTTSCSGDLFLLVPTSSSDVPGPVMYLYEDPSVPLYDFGRQDRNYSQYTEPIVSEWTIYREEALEYVADSSAIFFSQVLQNSINQPSYSYQFQVPIALQITGQVNGNAGVTFNLAISRVNLYVVYDKNVVYTASIQPNLFIQYRPLVEDDESNTFTIEGYVGNITFSNIRLVTYAGYLYQYVLKFTLSGSNGFSKKVIAGTELTNIDYINATIINSSGFTAMNSGFIFTGV
jgi:hypothetical protein